MSVPLDTVSDGEFLYASCDITMTIGSTPYTYWSKSIRLNKGATKIEGKNSAAVVKRKAYTKRGYYSGSADLMYPNVTGEMVPPELTVFTMTIPEISSSAKKYIITSVAPARTNDGEATCSIEFDEVLNDPVTVGA